MRRTTFSLAIACLSIGWILPGCDAPPGEEEAAGTEVAADPISVYVGSYPLAYFAERIGADRVAVEMPVPAGEDPAAWSPTPEVVLAYQDADLILLNGADYEAWTATATLPAGRIVDTSAPFADEIIFVEDAVTHTHGPEGEHSHGETASLTWLDLDLAIRQAEVVRDALTDLEPESAGAFRAGFTALEGDLRRVHEALEQAAQEVEGRSVLAAGVGYEYLARAYRLNITTIPLDPGHGYGQDFWHAVEHELSHGAGPLILWPGEPSPTEQDQLDRMGLNVIVFDPAGARPTQGDFLTVLWGNVERLEQDGGGS